MDEQLGIAHILGIAASVSLLAGWRLYLCILATGLAMRYGVLPLPDHLATLKVLASPWVMGTAGGAAVLEFLADKVPWIDTVWDTIHTLVRPLGGALLALSVVDPASPTTQALVFILGGGASLIAHGGKMGARAVLNASPEPVTNVVASTGEDIVTSGLLYLGYKYPVIAGGVAVVLLGVSVWLMVWARKVLSTLFRWPPPRPVKTPPSGDG